MNSILLLIILIPAIEIYLFINIGSQIGALTTILLIFTTLTILGGYLSYFYSENNQDIEEILKEKIGTHNVSKIFDLKHLRIAPAMLPKASDDTIRQTIIGEITKIHARQGIEREIKEAVEDLKGATDESLTWRVSRAAEANDSANKLQKGVSESELDNHKSLSDGLQALIDNQVWKKKKTK